MSRTKNVRLAGLTALAAAGLLALPGVASATVSTNLVGGQLTVSSDAADPITVACVGGKVEVNSVAITGNPDCTAITGLDVAGGPGANTINLAAVNETTFTELDSVSVDGGAEADTINGSQLADLLQGGAGNDRIIGDNNPGGTRDDMRGEDGDDQLVWNPGDGDDINEGGAGSDTAEVNGGGKEQFEVAPSATPGRVSFDRVQPDPSFAAPFNVDISDDTERLDLNAGGADDIVNSANGLLALAFAVDIDGGDGNDTLDGSDGPDVISGGNGNDRVVGDDNPLNTRDISRGDAGDDTLVWNGGDDDDVNEGGDGTDTIEVNGATLPEQFEIKASAIPGRVAFDRLNVNAPGPFNLDIAASERLDLNASGGDDTLNPNGPVAGLAGWVLDVEGGDGNDTLAGAAEAVDLLNGGAGADTLKSRDSSTDSLTCGTEVDSVIADAQDAANADCETVDRGLVANPAPPAPPAGPAADVTAPRVALARRAVLRGSSTRVPVRVTCPASEPDGCIVTIELRRKGQTLGRKRIELDGGEKGIARVRLSKAARALLKQKGTLAVKARVRAVDDAGNARTRVLPLTLVKR
jgi:Ca2+-binding RTX toxin-like protein